MDPARPDLGRVLQAAFQFGASDVHLKTGSVPMCRVQGLLRPVEFPKIEEGELEMLCERLTGRPAAEFAQLQQTEFSCDWPGAGRFRGHYFQQTRGAAVVLRVIPATIPTLEQLRLPPVIKRICEYTSGLVMVTGATGMGKSTTMASIVATMAKMSCRRIVTIEDPVEFLFEDGASCITQREVGRNVESFQAGLKAALRQDPDVVVIGEVRDRETMEVALHAAITGHLVLTAVHFADTTTSVNGVVGMADAKEQLNWRMRLGDALRAVVSQRLLPRKGGGGRVLATEVLINEPTVRSCILDESKTKGIRQALERGRTEYHTHTMDQSLLELVQNQLISVEVAQSAATSPGDLLREINLRRMA